MATQPPEHCDSSDRNTAGKKSGRSGLDYAAAARWASLATQTVGSVAVMAALGYFVDRELGSTPWGFAAATALGLFLGFYMLLKQASKWLK